MPYVLNEEAAKIAESMDPTDEGGLNWFISTYHCRVSWINKPRYATIRQLHRDLVLRPEHCKFLLSLKAKAQQFTWDDVCDAAGCAYREFMRRVGDKYEDKASRDPKRNDPYWDIDPQRVDEIIAKKKGLK